MATEMAIEESKIDEEKGVKTRRGRANKKSDTEIGSVPIVVNDAQMVEEESSIGEERVGNTRRGRANRKTESVPSVVEEGVRQTRSRRNIKQVDVKGVSSSVLEMQKDAEDSTERGREGLKLVTRIQLDRNKDGLRPRLCRRGKTERRRKNKHWCSAKFVLFLFLKTELKERVSKMYEVKDTNSIFVLSTSPCVAALLTQSPLPQMTTATTASPIPYGLSPPPPSPPPTAHNGRLWEKPNAVSDGIENAFVELKKKKKKPVETDFLNDENVDNNQDIDDQIGEDEEGEGIVLE